MWRSLFERARRAMRNRIAAPGLMLQCAVGLGASVYRDGRVEEDEIGLDGVLRVTTTRPGRRVAVAGKWEDLALDLEYGNAADINACSLRFTPSDNELAAHATQRAETGDLAVTFIGHSRD